MNSGSVTFTIRAIDSASSIVNKIGKSLSGLKGLGLNVAQSLHSVLSGMAHSVSIAIGAATAGITAMFGLLSRNAINLASSFEQSKIAFTGMLGSADAAKSLLDTLQSFANKTPFEFPQLVSATRLLMAYGFSVGELIPTLTAVGDAVSGLGGGAETLDRVMRAMGQIKSKGFLSGEEARQMAEAGINTYQMVAEAFGVSIPQAMKMSEQRIINADIALSAIVSGMEKRFPGMMAMQSQTFQGVTSTMRDVFNMGLRRLGEVALTKLTGIIKGLTALIEVVFSDANIERFAGWLNKIFSRENIINVATWLSNIYVWSKDAFSAVGEFGSKAVNWVTKSFQTLREYISKYLIPSLFTMTRIFIHLKSLQLGMAIATGMAEIAPKLPPQIAPFVLGGAIPAGLAAGIAADVAGQYSIGLAEKAFGKISQKLGDMNIPDFVKFSNDPLTPESKSIIDAFMTGFDSTMTASPVANAAMQTAANTGMLVQQNQSALSAIFGNGGDRMQALAARARFGNLANRGGGVSVNITVASQKDADNLRYALNYAAGMAK